MNVCNRDVRVVVVWDNVMVNGWMQYVVMQYIAVDETRSFELRRRCG